MSKPVKVTDKNKLWNKRRIRGRSYQVESMNTNKIFLIICEGVNTEPEYFKSFPVANAEIKSFGTGTSKTALVEFIIDQFGKQANELEIWAVFDMDRKEDQIAQQRQDYNNAIKLAKQNGIQTAYSNDAFELWFVLHYQFVDAKLHRNTLYEILSKWLDCNYEKEGKQFSFCHRLFDLLEEDANADMEQAIKHADRLFHDKKDLPFCDQNPCTTVYQLVAELNKYL